ISKKATLKLTPGVDSSDAIFTFMERQGSAWGARKEIIYNAMSAMNELLEAATTCRLTKNAITMETSFDEYNLDIDVHYRGDLLEFSTERPDMKDFLADPEATGRLAGYLVRQYTDSVTAESSGDQCHILMHFDH
ncbi:MAG: hypothetical protein KAT81_00555, partial [Syntrophobacterales bacterium]|nr:hypothetical protein [Syntrophobacterales bacterium]